MKANKSQTQANLNKLTAKIDKLEVKNAKMEQKVAQAKVAAHPTPAANTIAMSHVPSSTNKSPIKEAVKTGLDMFLSKGLETLVSLGSSLLTSDAVLVQIKEHNRKRLLSGKAALADNIIPEGTILASIPLCPSFATYLPVDDGGGPDATSRLQQKADTFLQYKFLPSTFVKFQPAAGALNNGQIGFFIPSDPRTEITGEGKAVTRLVHEYKGAVTNISQPASLKVPPTNKYLFVNDAHESDTRFTQQGKLWIVAFTDLVMADAPDSGTGTTSALGEFYLDYKAELKDDAVAGATITPALQQSSMVFVQEEAQAQSLITAQINPPIFAGINTKWPLTKVIDVNNSNFTSVTSDGSTWTFTQAGSYWVEANASGKMGNNSNNTAAAMYQTPFLCKVNGTTVFDDLYQVSTSQVNASPAMTAYVDYSMSANFLLQVEKDDQVNFYLGMTIAGGGDQQVMCVASRQQQISFTQITETVPNALVTFQRGTIKNLRRFPPQRMKYSDKPWLYYNTKGEEIEIREQNQKDREDDWVDIPGHPGKQMNLSTSKVRKTPV